MEIYFSKYLLKIRLKILNFLLISMKNWQVIALENEKKFLGFIKKNTRIQTNPDLIGFLVSTTLIRLISALQYTVSPFKFEH